MHLGVCGRLAIARVAESDEDRTAKWLRDTVFFWAMVHMMLTQNGLRPGTLTLLHTQSHWGIKLQHQGLLQWCEPGSTEWPVAHFHLWE